MIAQSKKISTLCLAATALLAGAFFLLPKGSHNSHATAKPLNPATAQTETTAPDQWKIFPADAMVNDVRWAPLTGDGSN
jgi:hypothetical protein